MSRNIDQKGKRRQFEEEFERKDSFALTSNKENTDSVLKGNYALSSALMLVQLRCLKVAEVFPSQQHYIEAPKTLGVYSQLTFMTNHK